jgi:hypothetical protein
VAKVPLEVPAPPPTLPVPPPAPESVGGGGTTVGFPRYGAEPVREWPLPPATPVEGGGATALASSDVPNPFRLPRGLPVASSEAAVDGGATTFAGNEGATEVLAFGSTFGGATTSLGPKILPIKLLMNDPPPACVGGGGTTDLDASGTLPLERRRMSDETSVEGGGATTEGAGKFNFELRELARSGAETGGGTTDGSIIRTGAEESCRLTAAGAGGITLFASAGAVRNGSRRATSCAGAATEGVKAGATRVRLRETFAAGGATIGASAGATRVWSVAIFGVGAASLASRLGAVSGRSRVIDGDGAITGSRWIPLRV